jgi:predicted MPP superfamily phosphohydrolase
MHFDWLNISSFLVLSVGHAALIVAFTNRLHALPLRHAILHRCRQLHDLIIVLLPALFAWYAGVHGPGLFFSNATWSSLPVPILAYLTVCGAVALTLPAVAVYRATRKPSMLMSSRSQTIDVAGELGYRPVGPGPYRILTSIPGNQFLELEVCEKELQVPRLPAEWDGLTILHLSDLHFTGVIDCPYFERVIDYARTLPADLVVFTGDLLDREDLVGWLPETLGRLSAPLACCFVLGNHDSYLSNVAQIRTQLESLGWRDLAGRSLVVDHCGQPLVICGSETPWMGCQPDLSDAPDDAFRLFLSHTPDNLAWARHNDVSLMLAGHNHGGQIRLPWFGPVYSPSAYGARYAAGIFWEKPTLLCVSRGISGRHPLRFNCLPELTRLTLRPAAKIGAQPDRATRAVASDAQSEVVC